MSMETMYFNDFFRSVKDKKIALSSKNREKVITILSEILELSRREESKLLAQSPKYLYTSNHSILWGNDDKIFENALYRKVSEEYILNTTLIRPYNDMDELVEAVKVHGTLLQDKHCEGYYNILSLFDRVVTIYYDNKFQTYLPYELAKYFTFTDGTPCGILVTLQEALEL